MVQAIGKDDFEEPAASAVELLWQFLSFSCHQECEDAILQGADVNADCGAGMCALHISALRGNRL